VLRTLSRLVGKSFAAGLFFALGLAVVGVGIASVASEPVNRMFFDGRSLILNNANGNATAVIDSHTGTATVGALKSSGFQANKTCRSDSNGVLVCDGGLTVTRGSCREIS
jgi:hypothetical protein